MRVNPPCEGCGGPHPFDTSVPSIRWNAVIRKAGLPDYLCLTCIVSAFVKAGESFTAELIGEEHPFEPIEVRTRSQHAVDAQKLKAENTELRAALTACLPFIDDADDVQQLFPDSAASTECRAAVVSARALIEKVCR